MIEAIVYDRESGGQLVRAAWIQWAEQQPTPKPSWLVPWDLLSEPEKEADRVIWERIARPYQQLINERERQILQLESVNTQLSEWLDEANYG
jgi:hypothetical protein